MENNLYLISLYDCYSKLLTEKQKNYFEDYYFNNFSLLEISENYGVSRNAVHKQIKEVVSKLEDLESKLELYDKFKKLENLSSNYPELKKQLEEIINKNS